jgi:hypothetical protein
MVIATGGPWPNIPAAIRALKGEAMTDPIRAAHGEMALQALEIIEEWAKTGKVEIARSLMGVGYEVGHLASNSVAVRETVFEAVLAAAKDDQK